MAFSVRQPSRSNELLDLEEVERRLRPVQRRYLGVRPIPLAEVVGTDGRAGDFSRDFRPRRRFARERMRGLTEAFPDGGFPPILAYKVGGAYFVIDGHHRVALARASRADSIDAEVTELVTRAALPSGADIRDVILLELERVFLDESGLDRVRPGVRIRANRPGAYLELLENVQIHGYHLMLDGDRVLPREEIARDWYETIYLPVANAVDRNSLATAYPDTAPVDVFLALYRRRRDSFHDCGCRPLEETVGDVKAEAEAAAGRGWRRFVLRTRSH